MRNRSRSPRLKPRRRCSRPGIPRSQRSALPKRLNWRTRTRARERAENDIAAELARVAQLRELEAERAAIARSAAETALVQAHAALKSRRDQGFSGCCRRRTQEARIVDDEIAQSPAPHETAHDGGGRRRRMRHGGYRMRGRRRCFRAPELTQAPTAAPAPASISIAPLFPVDEPSDDRQTANPPLSGVSSSSRWMD